MMFSSFSTSSYLPASFFSVTESLEIRSLKEILLNLGMQDEALKEVLSEYETIEEINKHPLATTIRYISINALCSEIFNEIFTHFPREKEPFIQHLFVGWRSVSPLSILDLIPEHQFVVAISTNNTLEAIRLLNLNPTFKDIQIHSIFLRSLGYSDYDRFDLSQILRSSHEEIERLSRWSTTPLAVALDRRNYAIAHALLNRQCDINALETIVWKHLNYEPQDKQALICLRKMVRAGIDLNISLENPILHRMALVGNIAGLKIILNYSEILIQVIHSINLVLPLSIVHIISQYYVTQSLEIKIGDPNSQIQIESSDYPGVNKPYLLQYKPEDICNLKGTTPLLAAAILCRVKTVRLLLNMGANASAYVNNPCNRYHNWTILDYTRHPVRFLERKKQTDKSKDITIKCTKKNASKIQNLFG